ncbi:hypothetical protein VaNZ11_006466 [Volvox africanus]|uniref:Uncharacterized protein n=1 Tax=Volvox africanus TaxID=51714 RepID=A0ABQ5S168_9CHLO|nr:hypothetical protein VaNZ11_006466 [Volvox africanus]
MTNAYTAAEHTNYHFDVNWESLCPALDRFAQFFISPTISRDGIEREVKAVDSEHSKNLQSDAWRKSQVNKATANSKHPWSRFSTGTYETLYTLPLAAGTDPRDAVADFYDRYYSADRSSLAVLGRQSLEELEEMVRPIFAPIPKKQLQRSGFTEDVFLPGQVGVLIKLVPVREGQSLELTWQVPPSERLYREQPLGYLSHLLGHEGDGSVFALLKAAGWASALWAGESGGSMSFTSFFTIHIDLTDEGQRNIREVATTVFRYLELLRRPGGICERIWEEVRGLAQLHFDSRDRSKPLTYCTTLSSGLQLYPAKDLLPAVYGVPREFSPSNIREALELMTPQRVRALWISKAHNPPAAAPTEVASADAQPMAAQEAASLDEAEARADTAAAEAAEAGVVDTTLKEQDQELLTEPVYGTRYNIGPLPAEWLAEWIAACSQDEPRLHLPAPNRFIPTDLSLADDESNAAGAVPTVAVAVPGRLRIWHKPETRFRQPKAVLYLDVQSPEAYTSPRAAVMTRLFTKLMLDYLNEVAYPAQQAGLDYNLLNTQSGWHLLLSGYNHKMPELLEEVLERLAGFKVLPDRFEFVREGLVREYANQLHNQPYSWAMYRAEMLTTARRWPIEVYGSEAATVTAEELQVFVRHRLCSRCFVEGLGAGNLRRREVLHCAALLLNCLRDKCGAAELHSAERAELRMLEIPPTPLPPLASPPTAAVSAAAAAATAAAGASRDATADAAESSSGTSAVDVGTDDGGGAEAASRDAANAAKAADGNKGKRGNGEGEREAVTGISGGWLFSEDVPNPQDENSAALVMYQVGPDDLRRNALRSLFVHLAKRDAFSELRTRQQLGYIVSLHGGSEHGVGYVEMLVQTNAFNAEELCHRLDDFMMWFLETGLPEKCGITATAATAAATASQASRPVQSGSDSGREKDMVAAADGVDWAAAGGQREKTLQTSTAAASSSSVSSGADTGANAADVSNGSDVVTAVTATADKRADSPTQFAIAVEELAKSKLETPKKLGDLANRWWSEVHKGHYCFDRQEAEVAQLRSLTPGELLSFARELLIGTPITAPSMPRPVPLSPPRPPVTTSAMDHTGCGTYHCKRLSVHIRGKGEATRAAAAVVAAAAAVPTAAAADASCGGNPRCRRPYSLIPEKDPFSWKRGCVQLPSVQALWAARRATAAAAGYNGNGSGGAAAGCEFIPYLNVAQDELEQLLKT